LDGKPSYINSYLRVGTSLPFDAFRVFIAYNLNCVAESAKIPQSETNRCASSAKK